MFFFIKTENLAIAKGKSENHKLRKLKTRELTLRQNWKNWFIKKIINEIKNPSCYALFIEGVKELILSLSNNFYIRHEAMWFNFQGIFIFLPFIHFSLFYACYWMWNIISKFKRKKENENEKLEKCQVMNTTYRL